MTNTININIKNCCCGSGATGSSSSGEIVPITELPDPTGIEGPPEGFGPPSSITDRQCKTAVFMYEWVYWWLDTVVNNSVAGGFVNLLASNSVPFVAKAALAYVLNPIIGAALASLVTWGIDITDAVIAPVAWFFSLILSHSLLNAIQTYSITYPVVEDILTKLPTYRDQIICYLSQAENQSEVYGQLENAFKDAGFSDGQIAFIFAVMPPSVIGLLYWSADWWPSFETETLASITETCCGSLTPGLPLPPGTVNKCDAANYIVDQMIELFNNTHEFVTGFNLWFNIFFDMEAEIFEHVQSDLTIPRKVEETAYNLIQYQRNLAKYMVTRFYFLVVDDLQLDTTFSGLATYFANNDDDIICALYIALDTDEVQSILDSHIDAYLATTDLDDEQKNYIISAITGIIHAAGQFSNLLFVQDSDLVGYTGVVDCSGCGGGDCDQVRIVTGSYLGSDVYQGGLVNGKYYLILYFYDDGSGSCGGNVQVSLSSPSGVTPPGTSYKSYRISSDTSTGNACVGWDLYCDDTLPVSTYCAKRLVVYSTTPFTIEVSIGSDC